MCWPWCCRLEMSIVQVLPFQGREAMKCFSVKFMGFSVGRSLSRAKRPWKSNLQQHLLLSAAMEELGGKVCNVAARRNVCRKNKGWMRLRSKKKSKEELTRNCIFYPIVEIPSDAWDMTFSYSLVYSLSMFLSEGVKQRKQEKAQPCLLQCSHASPSLDFFCPSVWCWQGCRNFCFQKHLSA